MDILEPFVAVLVILQESLKLLPKNVKLMAFTLIIPTLLSSLSFLICYPLYKPASGNFSTILPGLEEDFTILPGLDEDLSPMLAVVLFILVYSITAVYFTIATILVAANSHMERTLSYKDLALLTIRARRRQRAAKKYKSCSVLIYIVLLVASPALIFSDSYVVQVSFIPILAGIAAYIWYLNLSVARVLGSIISVVEENCSGVEALGKARRLLKGKRIEGFVLNLMFNVLVVILLFEGFMIIRGTNGKLA